MIRSVKQLRGCLEQDQPPAGLDLPLQALWHEARGEWDRAHDLCNSAGSREGDWVHAYLHRVEGDQSNADYWYRRARRECPTSDTGTEWELIVAELLARTD